jgi:hypothetical protein
MVLALWTEALGSTQAGGLRILSEIDLLWTVTSFVHAEWTYKYAV